MFVNPSLALDQIAALRTAVNDLLKRWGKAPSANNRWVGNGRTTRCPQAPEVACFHPCHGPADTEAKMQKSRSLSVLFATTWAFTACFAVWTMFGVIGIPIRSQLNLDSTEFGLLTATPVLTGAVFRLPLGIWTDRFGGRISMLLLLACRCGLHPMRPHSGNSSCWDWPSDWLAPLSP